MIRNDLKEKLGKDWRSKFSHRDCDQADYEFGEFEVDGKKIELILNPKTLDIMDWYYDDKEIDGWIEVDKVTLVHISPLFLTKNLKHKYYINKKYEIKIDNRNPRELSTKLLDRCPYPITSIASVQIKTHRLIAFMFIPNPNPEKYNIVNHKDKSRTNFNIENLEWCDFEYNAKRENQKDYFLGVVYERQSDGKRFTSKELSIEYNNNRSSSAVLGAIHNNKTYHGSLWKSINLELEKYETKHPLTNIWYKHPTINKLEVNSNGILKINNKVTVGTLHKEQLYYMIRINGKTYKTHRLIAEAKEGRVLSKNEIVDHIIPVSNEDINNEVSNLKIGSLKDNSNNPITKEKLIKLYNIKIFSLLGDELETFKSINDVILSYPSYNSNLIFRAIKINQGLLTYKNFIWCSGELFIDQLKEKLSFIYYKFRLNNDDSSINIVIATSNINNLCKNISSNEVKLLINTGMSDKEGNYYQQGDINNPIIDNKNIKYIKKREIRESWRHFSGR